MGCVLVSSQQYDVAALAADVTAACRLLDSGAGTRRHSLSLPAAGENQAGHRNIDPYAGTLGACPLFFEFFHSFQAKKASYRLLLRTAGTAYSLHDDRDAATCRTHGAWQ
jgi:hypothetical protein